MQIRFEDVYHMGLIVPRIEDAMDELSRGLGLTWNAPQRARVKVRDHAGDRILEPRVVFSVEGHSATLLELIEALPGTVWEAVQGSRLHHLGIHVDDVGEAVERMTREGMTLEVGGLDADGKVAGFCYLNDPLGVRMELVDRRGLPPLRD